LKQLGREEQSKAKQAKAKARKQGRGERRGEVEKWKAETHKRNYKRKAPSNYSLTRKISSKLWSMFTGVAIV